MAAEENKYVPATDREEASTSRQIAKRWRRRKSRGSCDDRDRQETTTSGDREDRRRAGVTDGLAVPRYMTRRGAAIIRMRIRAYTGLGYGLCGLT